MSRPGGNIRRLNREPKKEPVRVGAKEMLNLLRAQPGIFGDIPSENVEDLVPTIIFRRNSRLTCPVNPDIDILSPDAHMQMAEQEGEDPNQVARGYIVVAGSQLFLFPIIEDLERLGDIKTIFGELQCEFEGRATVAVGGVKRIDETYADLGALIFVVPELLRKANANEIGYLATQGVFAETIDAMKSSSSSV